MQSRETDQWRTRRQHSHRRDHPSFLMKRQLRTIDANCEQGAETVRWCAVATSPNPSHATDRWRSASSSPPKDSAERPKTVARSPCCDRPIPKTGQTRQRKSTRFDAANPSLCATTNPPLVLLTNCLEAHIFRTACNRLAQGSIPVAPSKLFYRHAKSGTSIKGVTFCPSEIERSDSSSRQRSTEQVGPFYSHSFRSRWRSVAITGF